MLNINEARAQEDIVKAVNSVSLIVIGLNFHQHFQTVCFNTRDFQVNDRQRRIAPESLGFDINNSFRLHLVIINVIYVAGVISIYM